MKRVATVSMLAMLGALGEPAQAQDVQIRGLMDVVSPTPENTHYLNQLNTNDGNFDALRTRVFLQSGRDDTEVHVQLILSDVSFSDVRLFGAYLQHKLWDARELYVQAGRIPGHVGTFAPRTYSDKNPLIGNPLAYYWKSSLPNRQVPIDIDDLVARRGLGQLGINYTDENGPRGAPWKASPLIYENCWDHGLFVMGKEQGIEYALGTTLGPPGVPVGSVESNQSLAVVAKVGVSPVEALRLHLSYGQGAYLSDDTAPYLPEGRSPNDYLQRIVVGSAEFLRGYLALRGEIFVNRFQTPLQGAALTTTSYYLESEYTLAPGWYVAARFDELRFGEVSTSDGPQRWDSNVRRLEGGFGHHLSRQLVVKAVVQYTRVEDGDEKTLPAVQASLRF